MDSSAIMETLRETMAGAAYIAALMLGSAVALKAAHYTVQIILHGKIK